MLNYKLVDIGALAIVYLTLDKLSVRCVGIEGKRRTYIYIFFCACVFFSFFSYGQLISYIYIIQLIYIFHANQNPVCMHGRKNNILGSGN